MRTFDSGYLNSNAFYATKSPIIQIRFPTDWPGYYAGFSHPEIGLRPAQNAFIPLSTDQQTAVRLALDMLSNYVAIEFTNAEVADGKKISFGFTRFEPSGVGYYPIWEPAVVQGDVFFNASVQTESFTPTAKGFPLCVKAGRLMQRQREWLKHLATEKATHKPINCKTKLVLKHA